MAGGLSPYEREVRDTVLKSTFTGVAATAIAIVTFSPAGFGDWIGASVASSVGFDASTSDNNPYAELPAFPAPFTRAEINAVRNQLAETEAGLALVRAATDDNIEQVRALALSDGVVTFAPVRRTAPQPRGDLRLSLSEPASFSPMAEAPVEAYVIESAQVEATAAPVSYVAPAAASQAGGGFDTSVPYRDPHLELADLLLAHETF